MADSSEDKAKLLYFQQTFQTEKCSHCDAAIYIKRTKLNRLHKEKHYRRCSGYSDYNSHRCYFIVCGSCAGDFCDFDSLADFSKVYNWTGNPWLGVHPRPIEDDDYVCCPECPARNEDKNAIERLLTNS